MFRELATAIWFQTQYQAQCLALPQSKGGWPSMTRQQFMEVDTRVIVALLRLRGQLDVAAIVEMGG